MRPCREVLNDRLLGGVLCVVLLLSFALQVAGAGRAAAAMMSPGAHPQICASADGTLHRPANTDPAKPCPCGDLCAAGLHVQTTPPPSDTAGLPIRFADRVERSIDPGVPPAAGPAEQRYEARGPPRLLV